MTEKVETKSKAPTVKDLKKENEQIKEQLAQTQKALEELTELFKANNFGSTITTNNTDSMEDVLVVSLVPHQLNLVGDDGIVYTFNGIYEEQAIDWDVLKRIVQKNRNMAQNGKFYILDESAVQKLRLKGAYQNMLTPDQLRNLFNTNTSKVIELYKLAPNGQKNIIIDLIKEKKFAQEKLDMNLLDELSRLSGVDLINIEDATQIDVE